MVYFSKIWLVLGAGSSHCLNCDLWDFCDYLDCMLKLPVMSRLDRYLEVTRIQGRRS